MCGSYHSVPAEANSFDIAGIYEKVELKSGSKVLDSYGNVKDAGKSKNEKCPSAI